MVDEKESGEGRPRRRRVRRWLAFGCALPLALLVCAFLFRGAWLGPLLIRWLREHAREDLGAELTIARVSGGWLSDLTLEGVSWRSSRPPLLRVSEARVELGYSLLGAWKGAPEPVVRVQGRGIELLVQRSAGGSGGGASTLPDIAGVELDLSEIVVHERGHEHRVESLRARGGLRAGIARVEELELAAAPNRVTLHDASVDLSQREWLAFARSTRAELAASLPDARVLDEIVGRTVGLRSAELTLSLLDGGARLAGKAEIENGEVRVEHGELVLPLSGDLEELQLDLDLRADIGDLAPVGEVIGQPLEGRWRGSIHLQGPWKAPVGRFVGSGEALRIDGLALDRAEIDVKKDGELARIEICEISGAGLEAVLRGGLRLHPLELVDVAVRVSADAAPLAVLVPSVPCEHAFLAAHLSGPPRALSGAFEVSATGVDVRGFRIDDAQARGEVHADTLDVAELRVTSGESFVEARGKLVRSGTDFTADLERLGLAWRGARAELERGAHLEFGPGRFAVDGLQLASETAGESGRARIALRHEEGTTRARLDFERYDAGPLLAPFLPEGWKAGRANGHVEGELRDDQAAAGGPSALALDLALEGWGVSSAWPELDARLRGEFDGHALALEDFALGSAADEALHARGALRVPLDPKAPLAFGPGRVELRFEAGTNDLVRSLRRVDLDPGLSTTGPCKVELDLAGPWTALAGTLGIEAEQVTLGTEAGARTCDLEARLAFGERTRIERAVFSAPGGTITLDGEVGVPLDVPHLSSDRLALLDAPLDLAAKLDLADIEWVAGLSGILRRVSGQVAGKVEIRGTAFEPDLGGKLELREGEVRVASTRFPPLRHVAANIALEGDVVRIEDLAGEAGGAPVRVSGTVEPFGPFKRLDLELAGQNLLVTRDSHLTLRADANLVVKGTPSQLAIRGELGFAEGRYTTEISPLEKAVHAGRRGGPAPEPTHFSIFPEGPLASSELDVHLGGTRTFEYRTNLLSASLRPDAWLRGTGAFPVIEGPVYVEEASLILPTGTMKLVSGVLTFRREAPLLPDLALTAEMRVQRHDVTAKITGPIPPDVVLSSTPPMALDDLWLLVLTGQLPAARGEDKESQAMEALAVFLARDTLVRWFGSEPGDAEGLLERFEIEVGAKPSDSGQPTGRVLFYLRPRDRKSGRATYLSAENDVHDRVNFAFGIVFRPR